MAKYNYKVVQLDANNLDNRLTISSEEKELISSFSINNLFAKTEHRVDLFVYSVDGTLLEQEVGYNGFTELLGSAGAGKKGSSNLVIDPLKDALKFGFDSGDVQLLYTFTDNLFSESQRGGTLFVEDINEDSTEFRALSINVTDEELRKYTTNLKARLNDQTYFSEYLINFGDNVKSIGLNIDLEQTEKGLAVVFKLYEPLPASVDINSRFTIEEKISDDVLFEITAELVQDTITIPFLKGPNYNVELVQENNNPTEYLNYNELFSYPVSSSYFELFSLFNEKGARITIDYTSFSEFIHFSSAEERLRNFKYKLDLITSYQESLKAIRSSSYVQTTITGSISYYENLISGTLANFDHYDRHLYFGSGSTSWPKTNSVKPYNIATGSATGSWWTSQIESAETFDNTNFDSLINAIPTYLREDPNNEQFLMFVHMIGHHFDNIWIYIKALSDKYDGDNRLDSGIARDLVRSAVESFGLKLYNSNRNLDNLFSMFVGETPSTGSERITSMSIATSGAYNYDYSASTAYYTNLGVSSSLIGTEDYPYLPDTSREHLQPVSKLDYEHEIYKRIYHNIPHLLKTKGTERGLRALINCFGIPESILSIKTFGGVRIESERYFGPAFYTTSSYLDKVRTDNTGSLISGSTLSRYVSTVRPKKKYTDDLHNIEIGFNISRGTDEFIDLKTSGSFDIDQYIGDPRTARDSNYAELSKLGRYIVDLSYWWNEIIRDWEDADWEWQDHLEYYRRPKAFIRLLNFFDSSLFRIIKDFVPARSNVDTGVIIKSHKLARSKTPQVKATAYRPEYSSSLSVVTVSGSQGGSYETSGSLNYTTNYNSIVIAPEGRMPRNVTDESPMFTGELSSSYITVSDGELTRGNIFLNQTQPTIQYDLTFFNLSDPLPPGCTLVISASYIGEFFRVYSTGSEPGTISITYPTSDTIAAGGSKVYVPNFDSYEFFTLQANDEGYPNAEFEGWYKQWPTSSIADRISTNATLTVYYEHEGLYGNKIYANFY